MRLEEKTNDKSKQKHEEETQETPSNEVTQLGRGKHEENLNLSKIKMDLGKNLTN
ncbi:hypothetical protein [Scytonema hofmannii]|uniref:hypothetical protein n=1 Tax=Scytonema hofmannii TaxID=34078 RepID=UPI00034C5ABE|nr:hypothetical protein [Scytonema hofmannii]